MQVILRKDVQNLGEAGDMVNVKDGYARNFLIPQNFAEVATKGAIKNREQNLQRLRIKQERLHNEALELAKKIENLKKIELTAKAGESGKLFGTITTKKLAEELNAKLGIEIDRKNISLDSAINKLGEFRMLIKLTSKVKTELPVIVTASEIIKEEIISEQDEIAAAEAAAMVIDDEPKEKKTRAKKVKEEVAEAEEIVEVAEVVEVAETTEEAAE